MLILGLCPRMDYSSSRFFGASRSKLSRVLRTAIPPPPCETSIVIYPSTPFILTVHLLIIQVATWVLVPSNAFLNLLWVTADKVTLFRGHSFINVARQPAVGIKAEVIDSSIIAPPPCPHSCPPMLVLSFGTTRRAALDGVLLFPSMTSVRRGQNGPRRCLPVALGLP